MGAQATGGHYDNQSSEVGSEYWKYSWDEDDRLVQVSKGVYASGAVLVNEFTVHYSYDSMGRMLRRDNGTDVTTFVWDGWDLLSETTGSVTTTYLVPDGLVWSFSRGEDVFQVHTDALGSVRVVTDSDGDVVARFEYGSWGELLPGSFDNVGLALRFVGALGVRTDSDTGLLWMRHRWYDPTSQRFISRDPKGLEDDSNAYGYVANNPLVYIDPTGLEKKCCKRKCWVIVVYRQVTNPISSSSNKGKTRPDQHKLPAFHTDIYLKCQNEDCSISLTVYTFGPMPGRDRLWPRLGRLDLNEWQTREQLLRSRQDITTQVRVLDTDVAAQIRMEAASQAIDQSNVPYQGLNVNSNTAADIVLRAATGRGLPPTNLVVPPFYPR